MRQTLIALNVLAIVLIVTALASAQPAAVVALECTWDKPTTGPGQLDNRQWWLEYEIGYYDQMWQWRTYKYVTTSNGLRFGAMSDDQAHQAPALPVTQIPDWNPSSYMITWELDIYAIPIAGGPNYVLHKEVGNPLDEWWRVKAHTGGYLYYDGEVNQWETYSFDRKLNQTVTGPFPGA